MTSVPASGRDRASPRFVSLYALAWVPFLFAYGGVLAVSLQVSTEQAAMGAIANVLPPALLGWPILQTARAASRRRLEAGRTFGLHAALACLYALASAAGTWLIFKIFHRMISGAWDWTLGGTRALFWQLLISTLIYVVLAGFGKSWALGEQLREEERRSAWARELAARSQLTALRSRLDPHFLFNTLHSLLALVRRDPEAAEEALERFGDLLRYVLDTRGPEAEEVTVAEERDFLADYLELEGLRLGDRLRVAERIETAAFGCRVPAFTLQPLVENALRHGVAPRSEGGRVEILGRVEGRRLELQVRDDGPGARPDEVADGGLGLELVRERLKVIHGKKAGLEVTTAPEAGFAVRVWLPAQVARGEPAR